MIKSITRRKSKSKTKTPDPSPTRDHASTSHENCDKRVFRDGVSSSGMVEDITDKIKINRVKLLKCPNLKTLLPDFYSHTRNSRRELSKVMGKEVGYQNYMDDDNVILADIVRNETMKGDCLAYVRAGPRESLYFDPAKCVAAIVTCGGLCPGLNNVIREIVHTLKELYGVDKIFGFRGGYGGIYTLEPMVLDIEAVAHVHELGGTMLSSSRGGFDAERILDKLDELGINQLYCIGGDGTMRGAQKLHTAALERARVQRRGDRVVAIAGVPKTIDNDIVELDRSFGFFTAVEEAVKAIRSAKTEARCLINGVGVVKLMGRSSGFIAAHASLASGDCDLCLVPEVPIQVGGDKCILEHVARVLERKGHCVVVVAEGAGEELLGQSAETDASGNRKLPAIGYWLKERLKQYFEEHQVQASGKYIDPSYMIRSVKANAADSTFCLLLSQNVVHGVMAGYSGFCVGLCNDRLVYLPMKYIVEHSPRMMNPNGRTWERVLSLTQQPA